MLRPSFFWSYGTFNRDFLKNSKPGRLIEPVRLIEWWEYFYPDSFSYPRGRKLRSVHYSHNARGYTVCPDWLASEARPDVVTNSLCRLPLSSSTKSQWERVNEKKKPFITALTHLSLLLIRVLHFLLFIKTYNVCLFLGKVPTYTVFYVINIKKFPPTCLSIAKKTSHLHGY